LKGGSVIMFISRLSRIAPIAAFFAVLIGISTNLRAVSIDFEDVSLPPSGYYNGADPAAGFTSRGVFFPALYTDWGNGMTSWENWACSKTTDILTGNYSNQYSAIPGKGANDSLQYAVGFPSFNTGVSSVSLPQPTAVLSADFTNTTYAYLTMLNGYFGAKKFGGKSGNDQDWFKLTITGKDATGNPLGTLLFYLADYREPDNRPDNPIKVDYIYNNWTSVDLSSLGNNVSTLEFGLSSSDNGDSGMNTPGYFAMDNLTLAVPEPGTLVILLAAVLGLLIWRIRL
jgi:hypothetical protein